MRIVICAIVSILFFYSGCLAVHSWVKTKDDPDAGGFDCMLSGVLFLIACALMTLI